MPDQKKPNEPSIITVPVTPPLTDTATETPPAPPALPSLDVDVSSLPDEVSSTYAPTLAKDTVKSDPASGSATPVGDMQGLGIPPVISSSKPKGKFSGKTIATILGVLILVGGLGAGVVLVRQQQDIREKAMVNECTPGDKTGCTTGAGCPGLKTCGADGKFGSCVDKSGDNCPATACTPGESQADSCTTGSGCQGTKTRTCSSSGWGAWGSCEALPGGCPSACTPGESEAQSCTINGQQGTSNRTCSSSGTWGGWGPCQPLPTQGNGCANCPTGYAKAPVGSCGEKNPPASSCYENGVQYWCCPVADNGCANCPTGYAKAPVGSCGEENPPASSCYENNVQYWCCPIGSTASPKPKETPTAPPDNPQIQCQNVKAYDTNWKLLTAAQLSALKASDKVRFTISGTATGGTIDKAMFKINGGQDLETSQKKPPESGKPIPAVEEFYIEYTIPAGTTSFTITAKLHHSTLGWL